MTDARTTICRLSIVVITLVPLLIDCNNSQNKHTNEYEKLNLEQSIAAVFNKVAYGSTTKRSIADNAYPVTTLATPLLTTYRYTNGDDEYLRVDLRNPPPSLDDGDDDVDDDDEDEEVADKGYGAELERDHALPTSAPAADILKNNQNRHYANPNRYNNDRLRPDRPAIHQRPYNEPTTTGAPTRNVRPTKSIYSKDVPSYVPPSRAFFTPPLPPEYQNPFADKPTLRGTNSEGFASRRPLPPPSLMPNKDRIPFRPDLPKSVDDTRVYVERKKTLNTPSQNGRDLHQMQKLNETTFEYEKSYAPEPSITRILSGSNGRHDDIPDILFRTVTATPRQRQNVVVTMRVRNSEADGSSSSSTSSTTTTTSTTSTTTLSTTMTTSSTTPISDMVNLPNVKERETTNVTTSSRTSSDEIWTICWNVHVYLVVIIYILLAIYSIFKLIRYENDPHMFSKSYFLTIHLMLTVICVLRIFYLTYDPYNIDGSFNVFLYDFLHSFPLSLLATTFAVLILFLLKRTLTHLEVKTRPVFLVVFALIHIVLCLCMSIVETFGQFEKANLIVCKPIFVLLTWALGFSYLYLYHIIRNVLAKKSQNLSEICTQNISYASHITIAVALLFVVMGFVQLYALFFIKIDRFDGEIKHHWILWGFELSVRVLEISIIVLLAIVVSLRMSQREKPSNSGFPLFPCTTSDSSTDNIYPNNCNTNPNAMNYTRNEMLLMDGVGPNNANNPSITPNTTTTSATTPTLNNDSFERRNTLDRHEWTNDALMAQERFDRISMRGSSTSNTTRKHHYPDGLERNIYSEPIDNNAYVHQYERTRHDFERGDLERRSRGSNVSTSSGRRIMTSGRTRSGMNNKQQMQVRSHLGVHTLPNHQYNGGNGAHSNNGGDSMLVDEQGFVRFRHMQDDGGGGGGCGSAGGSMSDTSNRYGDA